MKIQRNDINLVISELHPNDYYLLIAILNTVYKLLSNQELESFIDEQEKEKLLKDLERILSELSIELGSKTAESQAETIIRKVIEKA